MTSLTASIRGIAPRRNQQWNVVVRARIGDPEIERHLIDEGRACDSGSPAKKVRARREHKAIRTWSECRAGKERPVTTPIGIGDRRPNQFVTVAHTPVQTQADPRAGFTVSRVKNVGGEAAL